MAIPREDASCVSQFAGNRAPTQLASGQNGPITLLCSDSFAVLSSGTTRGPLWGAEDLTEEDLEIAGNTPRTGMFHPEWRLAPDQTGALAD